jgi:hypothetical protein
MSIQKNLASNEDRWLMSSFMFGKPLSVNREKGVIEGVSVNSKGEAKGHGVFLDDEFIDNVVLQGNEKKQGVKVRFGHPNMSSTALGTFLGRVKNFRRVGDQAKADLFLSNAAKETPQGNLYDYVLNLAENDSDMFGMSIVFERGKLYQRDEDGEKIFEGLNGQEKVFIELDKLLASDLVDSPAANEDGLFSSFNQATFAGQVTEFLDLHPHIFSLVEKNPDIIEKFMNKYNEYIKLKNGELAMSEDIKDEIVKEVTEVTEELEEIQEEVEEIQEEVETLETETTAEVVEELSEVQEKLKVELDIIEKDVTKEAIESFKAFALENTFEFACEHYGKSELEILKIKNEKLKEENEKLKTETADAIIFSEEEAEQDINMIVQGYKNEGLSASEAWRKAHKEHSELINK